MRSRAEALVEELDSTSVESLEGRAETVEAEQVKCGKCGAEEVLQGSHFAARCSFCGSAIVSKSYAGRRIEPRSIVPFQLDARAAHAAFRDWLRWRWLAPMDLKRYARTDASLAGVYLPFWTYDCETVSQYRGQRGTRRDKTTTWTSVSGRIGHFHDDVLVPASHSLPASIGGALARWDTAALVPYKPELVERLPCRGTSSGSRSRPGGARDDRRRDPQPIQRDIRRDAQRIDSVQTRYGRFTFKHVLLPTWVSAYRYRDKVYRFVVNGQTGRTSGESPLSWWKVAGLVILALVVLYNMR